jgi:hypothetical protein
MQGFAQTLLIFETSRMYYSTLEQKVMFLSGCLFHGTNSTSLSGLLIARTYAISHRNRVVLVGLVVIALPAQVTNIVRISILLGCKFQVLIDRSYLHSKRV